VAPKHAIMKRTIMIIEDNNDIRENTAELLELEGFDVLTAENGAEALEVIAARVPDMIICDILMPKMDGYHTLEALRKNKQTAGLPFIFITAKSERWELEKAYALGITNYLIKPFDEAELLFTIHRCLNS